MLSLADYDYNLPRALIAQHPLSRRSDARLMRVDREAGTIEHFYVRDLPELLQAPDCVVVNNTQVIPARLVGFRTQTAGRWEGLFLSADPQGNWRLLGKTRGKLQAGETISLVNERLQPVFSIRLLVKEDEGTWIARPDRAGEAVSLLAEVGRVPLPHYIRDGEMEAADRQRYQTIFAHAPGAVAAPTAGLHFTPQLCEQLVRAGVLLAEVTLHVGLDTFRPITADRVEEHPMHSEWCQLSSDTAAKINASRQAGGRTIAVGTTTTRTLETAASVPVDQPVGPLQAFSGPTRLYIHPPYSFRAVDAMLTNFHLPRTTLLVLVRTFGGDQLIRRAYDEAIREEYRFYSYGDAMLII